MGQSTTRTRLSQGEPRARTCTGVDRQAPGAGACQEEDLECLLAAVLLTIRQLSCSNLLTRSSNSLVLYSALACGDRSAAATPRSRCSCSLSILKRAAADRTKQAGKRSGCEVKAIRVQPLLRVARQAVHATLSGLYLQADQAPCMRSLTGKACILMSIAFQGHPDRRPRSFCLKSPGTLSRYEAASTASCSASRSSPAA